MENLSLSPGRMAGNYSFLYILTKILINCKPQKILELGLGESTKLISEFIKNELTSSTHFVVEHDNSWISFFNNSYKLSNNSHVIQCELNQKHVKGYQTNSYSNLIEKAGYDFDFYVIDGPFGSSEYSRYDIVTISENFSINQKFIILIDDYSRKGEKQTTQDLLDLFNNKGIESYSGVYSGDKDQIIIVSKEFKFLTTL